jgi:hypothetical protein
VVNFFILNNFFSLIFLPFHSFCVLLCRQRIRNIHCRYLNKFSSSFISHQFPHSLSRFIIFICILYLLFTWQHSLERKKKEAEGKTTKRKAFFSAANKRNKCTQHFMVNPLENDDDNNNNNEYFFPSLSSDKWTLWS